MPAKLYEVGLNYDQDISESDLIVFNSEEEAQLYIKAAAVKMMIGSVTQYTDDDTTTPNYEKLETLSQKIFKKKVENVTGEDIDALNDKQLEELYSNLSKLQDKGSGVQSYFYEEVKCFTDKDEKEYTITLKPKA